MIVRRTRSGRGSTTTVYSMANSLSKLSFTCRSASLTQFHCSRKTVSTQILSLGVVMLVLGTKDELRILSLTLPVQNKPDCLGSTTPSALDEPSLSSCCLHEIQIPSLIAAELSIQVPVGLSTIEAVSSRQRPCVLDLANHAAFLDY